MRKPVKLRSSWSLRHEFFFFFFSIHHFIMYKQFENNYVLPVIYVDIYFLLICLNSY